MCSPDNVRRIASQLVLVFAVVLTRMPCAAGQSQPAEQLSLKRTWVDSSGLFRMEAELVSVDEQAVKLRKADGKDLRVLRSALSREDQAFLTELEKEKNPFAEGMQAIPDATRREVTATFPNVTSGAKVLETLTRVVIPQVDKQVPSLKTETANLITVEPGETYIDSLGVYGAKCSPIILLDSKNKTIAFSAHAQNVSGRKQNVTKLFVGKLPSGPFKKIDVSEYPTVILDHHEPSGQSLAISREIGDYGDRYLVLLSNLSSGTPLEVCKFRLPTDMEGKLRVVEKGVFINEKLVALSIEGVLFVWDIRTGAQVYQTIPSFGRQRNISFSDDRQLVAWLSATGDLHLLELATGKDLGCVARKSAYSVAFNPYASQMAISQVRDLGFYDLEQKQLRAPEATCWFMGANAIGWISPDLVFTENGAVFQAAEGYPVWKYDFQKTDSVRFWKDSLSYVEVGEHVLIRTVAMPHPRLKEELGAITSVSDRWLIEKGGHVKVEYSFPDPLPEEVKPEEVKKLVKAKIAQAGWVEDDQASVRVLITITDVQSAKNEASSAQAISKPVGGTTVEMAQIVTTVALLDSEGEIVWSQTDRTARDFHTPQTNVASEVLRKQIRQGYIGFFHALNFPARVAKPPYTYGAGESQFDNNVWREVK